MKYVDKFWKDFLFYSTTLGTYREIFRSKFFDEMVNKRDSLKIINLFNRSFKVSFNSEGISCRLASLKLFSSEEFLEEEKYKRIHN